MLLLAVIVFACYAPSLRDGFVWDDTALILRDPLIRSWRLIPEGFNHYLFVDATPSDFYRPVQRLSYTIDYALFAARPAPYHLTNILIHLAGAIVLMLLTEALLDAFGYTQNRSGGFPAAEAHPVRHSGARWIAVVTAVVWAIHPIHTSAVVYVSGRADPLAALFGFLGCYLALRSLVRPPRQTIFLTIGAGAAFLCSGLSKESGLIFPILMLTVLTLLKQRDALMRLLVVSLFVGASYLSLRLPAEHDSPPPMAPAAPLAVRPLTVSRAIAEYAGLLLLPVNLHMERNVRGSFGGSLYANTAASAGRELQTLGGIILAGALVFWMIRARKRDRLQFALLFAALISYLPVSGIIRLNASVAEHWLYVPSAFLLLIGACAIVRYSGGLFRAPAFRTAATAMLAGWMLFLGARTFVRTFDWKDQRTFLERTIAAGGDSARMLINLASLESSENRLDLAKKHLDAALKKEPNQPFAVLELATVAIKQNDFSTARDLLGRATEMPIVAGPAHELIAVLENKEQGRADLLRMRLAAHSGIPNWSTEKRYVKLLAETGAIDSAIRELQSCLQTQWYRAESWQLLSQLLASRGQAQAAAEALTYANSYDVHLSLRPAIL